MKLKKLLAAVLTGAMVIGSMATSAFASDISTTIKFDNDQTGVNNIGFLTGEVANVLSLDSIEIAGETFTFQADASVDEGKDAIYQTSTIDPTDGTLNGFPNIWNGAGQQKVIALGDKGSTIGFAGGCIAVVDKAGKAVTFKEIKYNFTIVTFVGEEKVTLTATGTDWTNPTTELVIKKVVKPVEKKTQKITKAVTSKTLKAKNLKKKAATFKIGAKAKGAVSYKVVKKDAKKKVTVSTKGKVTVKKGTKKGTYTVKVKISAKSTKNYKAKSVTKTIKVTVK